MTLKMMMVRVMILQEATSCKGMATDSAHHHPSPLLVLAVSLVDLVRGTLGGLA